MSDYTVLPAFQTGDLLSASRLNQMLDNIDVLIGLDEQRQLVYDSGADVRGWNGNLLPWCRDRGYPVQAGVQVDLWIAHNGDTLKVYLGDATITSTAANLWYDYEGDNEQGPIVVQPNAERTITIPNANLFYQYQPVRVFIQQAGYDPDINPNATPALYVRYLYATDSNAPTIGSTPAFTDGDPSSATDLNDVLTACDNALANLNQPLPCVFHLASAPAWTEATSGGGDVTGLTGWFRYTHNTLKADMVLQGPLGSSPNYYDRATWYVDGTAVWTIDLRDDGTTSGPVFKRWDKRISVNLDEAGLSLTPGDWYKVEFVYQRTLAGPPGLDRGQTVAVWDYHFLHSEQFATFDPLTRWEHGDTVAGDDGDPMLADMSNQLEDFRDSLRWYNQACRAATSFRAAETEVVDQMAGYRVHRWLAYENFVLEDGERSTATLQWNAGGRNLQSYSLPEVEVPSFVDLESTPIKPGMYFRLSGVKFGIQTPTPGTDYA